MTIVDKIKWRLKRYNTAYFANAMGYNLVPKGLGYFSVQDVVPKALAAGKSLCDYLEDENIGGVGRRRDLIIDSLRQRGVFHAKSTIIEIGAGTGIYLEKTIEHAQPERAEVYETALDWVAYLREQHSNKGTKLICHNADGRTLKYSPDTSADLILAHAVFVYIPMLSSMRYLIDSARVLKPGGLLVFDVFNDLRFHLETVNTWLNDGNGYVFPVVMSDALIREYAAANRLRVVDTFDTPLHASHSTYYILQKD
jgi:SAM-dependent methyltransferase